MQSQKLYSLLNLILISLALLFIALVHYNKDEKTQEVLQADLRENNANYRQITNHYMILAERNKEYYIKQKNIISIFKNAKDANRSKQAKIRKELYENLILNYKQLQKLGFKQFHFHLPNNTSFLRMHKPYSFGDDLSEARYSVKTTNETKQATSGFEAGRITHSFRFVYPIFDEDNEHLGSVEVSISAFSYAKIFQNYYNSDIHFLIKKSHVDKILSNNELTDDYIDSAESPLFYREIDGVHTQEDKTHFNTLRTNESFQKQVAEHIKEEIPFVLFDGENSSVSFIPIHNLKDNRVIAYFTVYTQNNEIKNIIFIAWLFTGIVLLILIISLSLVRKEFTHRAYVKDTNKDLSRKNRELKALHKTLEAKISEQGKEINKSKEYYQEMVENAIDWVWEVDINAVYTFSNKKVLEILGYSAEEVLGKTPFDFMRQEEAKRISGIFSTLVENRELFFDLENEHIHKNGRTIICSTSGMPIYDVNDVFVGYRGFDRNITQHKALEKEKAEHQQQSLQQSRLAQMGEMISMIAHQWRQPLGAISSTTANLALKLELEAFDLETAEGIKEASKYFTQRLHLIDEYVGNLTSTIDDFRNFYRPNKESVLKSFKEISNKALNIIKASLENDNIELIFEYDSEEKVEMYDSEMMQVVLNFFKNAQDNFNEKNIQNRQIHIKTSKNCINISDNGGGITEEIMGKIFDPYFSTKNEKNGTGLGLYMCKLIIEDHHKGKLEAKNTEDGVCFSITLDKDENENN